MGLYLEILGYVASLVVLVSLIMSSIKRLRWINLAGAALFSVYGFMIGSIPTGVMNLGIVAIDIYYLVQIYSAKDYITYLIVEHNSRYLRKLLKTQTEEVDTYFPEFDFNTLTEEHICYISLRNLNAAGALILLPKGNELQIELDYALKQYRDFKTTMHILEREAENLKQDGFDKVVITTTNTKHIKYLAKVNFVQNGSVYEYKL